MIAHDAASVCFGLIYWWQSADELHQRVFTSSPLADPGNFQRLENPGAGCVWELGIIDFERRAWIEDVLANPAGRTLSRYLSRTRSNADVWPADTENSRADSWRVRPAALTPLRV